MGHLTTFLYDYLVRKANDPNSSVWLPKSLKQYMPLKKEDTQVIDISASKGKMSDQLFVIYSNMVDKVTKSNPEIYEQVCNDALLSLDRKEPDPSMSVSNLVINGIENLKLEQLTSAVSIDHGYKLVFSADGPAYSISEYKDLEPVSITMDYCLEQKFCAYDKAKADQGIFEPATEIHAEQCLPGGWPECDLILKGSMTITLLDGAPIPIVINPDVNYTIKTDDKNRDLCAEVCTLAILADAFANGTYFDVTALESNFDVNMNDAKAFLQNQMGLIPVKTGIIQSINATLGQEGIKKSMSDRLTKYTLQAFEKVLGAAPGDLPTTAQVEKNEVDQYIFDRIRYSMCFEESKYYLKKVIQKWQEPCLDDWKLGDIDVGPGGEPEGVNELEISSFLLTDVEMKGLSQMEVTVDDIGFILGEAGQQDLATMAPLLKLTIQGGLHITMKTGDIIGAFTVHLDECPLDLKCVISGDDVDNLTITVDTVKIDSSKEHIHIDLDINARLKEFLEAAINTQGVLDKLVKKINDKFDSQRDSLSKSVTEKIRQALINADA